MNEYYLVKAKQNEIKRKAKKQYLESKAKKKN
jgi:hypothetical protein